MGVDMLGFVCYIIIRLGLQRLDLASRCSTNVYSCVIKRNLEMTRAFCTHHR
jgi:hypothetical protein